MDRPVSPADLAPEQEERRRHHRVRAIFAEACELVAPFFAEENRWGNVTLDHLAYHVVRDRYPELSFEEVHILVIAAKRIHSAQSGARATR